MSQFAKKIVKAYPIWVVLSRAYYPQDWVTETQIQEEAGLLTSESSEGRRPLSVICCILWPLYTCLLFKFPCFVHT